MAEYALVEERLISGSGVLRVSGDGELLRYLCLYTDVIRMPRNKYLNRNYNPERSRYATISLMRSGYLIATIPVEYPRQAFDGVQDYSGQTLLAVKCSYVGVLQSFINLGLALGLPPIEVTNTITDYANLRLSWDEARIVCYADTALQCRLYGLPYDVCDPGFNADMGAFSPPDPLPLVPIGMPIGSISPPYDGDTSDNGNTAPFNGDEVDNTDDNPFADLTPGQSYRVRFTFELKDAAMNTVNVINFDYTVKAPIYSYGLSDDLRQQGVDSASAGGYVIATGAYNNQQTFYLGYGYAGGTFARNLTGFSVVPVN